MVQVLQWVNGPMRMVMVYILYAVNYILYTTTSPLDVLFNLNESSSNQISIFQGSKWVV